MLSDASASVLELANDCVSYSKKHKHHKCNLCGLYGHIKKDCMAICTFCGGKHLRNHCVKRVVDELKGLINHLRNDFVKDYNLVKNKLNTLNSRDVIYTHLVEDSCVRLTFESNQKASQQSTSEVSEIYEQVDLTNLYESTVKNKPLMYGITHKVDMNTFTKWGYPSIFEKALGLDYKFKSQLPPLAELVNERYNTQVDVLKTNVRESSLINSKLVHFKYAHLFGTVRYKRTKYSTYTIKGQINLRSNAISISDKNKILKPKLEKLMKSYDYLAKKFDDIRKDELKLNKIDKLTSENLATLETINQKLSDLTNVYDRKKKEMIASLKESFENKLSECKEKYKQKKEEAYNNFLEYTSDCKIAAKNSKKKRQTDCMPTILCKHPKPIKPSNPQEISESYSDMVQNMKLRAKHAVDYVKNNFDRSFWWIQLNGFDCQSDLELAQTAEYGRQGKFFVCHRCSQCGLTSKRPVYDITADKPILIASDESAHFDRHTRESRCRHCQAVDLFH